MYIVRWRTLMFYNFRPGRKSAPGATAVRGVQSSVWSGEGSVVMGTERERPKDEDVPFELPERYFSKEKSGFKAAAKPLGTKDEPRRVPRDPKDVPRTPLAERKTRRA